MSHAEAVHTLQPAAGATDALVRFTGSLRYDALPEAHQNLLATPLEVKAVFAIREDRLSTLDGMADKLPAILHKRFPLLGLSHERACDAVVKPAANLTRTKRGRVRRALIALSSISSNAGGISLGFAFITILGAAGMITILLRTLGIDLGWRSATKYSLQRELSGSLFRTSSTT